MDGNKPTITQRKPVKIKHTATSERQDQRFKNKLA